MSEAATPPRHLSAELIYEGGTTSHVAGAGSEWTACRLNLVTSAG